MQKEFSNYLFNHTELGQDGTLLGCHHQWLMVGHSQLRTLLDRGKLDNGRKNLDTGWHMWILAVAIHPNLSHPLTLFHYPDYMSSSFL